MGVRRFYEPDPETIYEDLIAAVDDKPRWTRKGDKRPRWEVERKMAAYRRNLKARQIEALRRAEARQRKPSCARAFGKRIVDHMLRAMVPGQWHGSGEIARAAGALRHARGKMWQVMQPAGWIERVVNPAYDPGKVIFSTAREPRYLWRLTRAGEMMRERLSELDRGEHVEKAGSDC